MCAKKISFQGRRIIKPKSPITRAGGVVTFSILSEGTYVDNSYKILQISVDQALGAIPSATISMIAGDATTGEFDASDSDDFVPGKEIEIKAGYSSDEATIFKGIVTGMRLRVDASKGPILDVTCRDKAIAMISSRKSAYFLEMKDSDIIEELIGGYSGLSSDIDSTSHQYSELVQYDATDWDFLMIRAEVNGFVVSVNDGNIEVKAPEVNSSPSLVLTFGESLIDFSAELDSSEQTSNVEAYSWNPSEQQLSESVSSEPEVPGIGNLSGKDLAGEIGNHDRILNSSAQIDEATLKSWADADLLKNRLSLYTGKATFSGSSEIKPNSIVQLRGLGARFSGNVFVSAVTHKIQEGTWTTETQLGLKERKHSSANDTNAPAASGLSPKIGGLMVGKVKQLEGDPNGESQILVSLPMIQDDNNAVWARLASLYATDSKGSFFIPEIEDEVVLGFLNNDPNHPIILGSLHSSDKQAPYTLSDDNYIKSIVTKSDCKIEIDDDRKTITIKTPGDNQIVFSDDAQSIALTDQNSNSITTDDNGIVISDKNGNKIIMSDSGVEITSSSDIKVSAEGDITLSGTTISNSASATFKAEGAAGAEFTTSAVASIEGSLVKIN